MVLGGAGYIGSHMCKLLAEHGHQIAVVDDLSTGHLQAVKWGKLYQGNIGDAQFLGSTMAEFQPESLFHFAAKSIVSDSTRDPASYYLNNAVASLNVLEQVRLHHCPIIFSSTAAVYGIPIQERIDETHPRDPISPYGKTKLSVEYMLQDYWAAYQLPSVSFRYFNAAGADAAAGIGEAHLPETHLIPKLLEAAAGRAEPIKIFGSDYDTADGTCVRDYIHVSDLCRAHLLGLEYLQRSPGSHCFNLGNGAGFSVRQVIASTEAMLGATVPYEVGPRRPGDPPRLVANAGQALEKLGWRPEVSRLEDILASAWSWHRNRKF